MDWFGIGSYAAAAVVYGVLTLVLAVSHPGGRSATYVIAASAISTIWAVGMAVFLLEPAPLALIVGLDALLVLGWTACALSWFEKGQRSVTGTLLATSVGFAIWGVTASIVDPVPADGEGPAKQSVYLALLGTGLVGLLAVEQLLRNAAERHRDRLRLLCFGISCIFVLNVFIYSQASLLGSLLPVLWGGRGLLTAAAALVIVMALKKMSEWERGLFVSRQIVFYSASLVGVGGYLLSMGMAGYVIHAVGGEWGVVLQSVYLVVAIAILVVVMFSARIRARAKVFLVKHFYRNKYDYREEWLRLTATLGRGGDARTLARNALQGVTRIVGSEEGSLWLTTEGQSYDCVASHRGIQEAVYGRDHPLVRFLASSGWVVDTEQYRLDPHHYGFAFGDPGDNALPENSLIVPLDRQGFLQGFVVVRRSPGLGELNFEDHDILKTAGRQVAVVLAQALAQEQLAATRQFEAVNKLSTFLMHDLKNVVAQQELVVANAKKFKHRPEFIEDTVRTLEAGAQRMRHILSRLENASHTERASRVDLVKLLKDVCMQCADRRPVPILMAEVELYRADIDRERVAMAVTHAIRNAQDATSEDGHVEVRFAIDEPWISISVVDTGVGMTHEFVRDRLFKPFDSTKGAKGMGVGAYQIRETFRAVGGDVLIDSQPGRGTAVKMLLPASAESRTERSVA